MIVVLLGFLEFSAESDDGAEPALSDRLDRPNIAAVRAVLTGSGTGLLHPRHHSFEIT